MPTGPGFGYEIGAQRGETNSLDGRLVVNAEQATGSLWLQQIAGRNLGQAELSGSMLFFGDRPFLTRSLQQGFALVRVPGIDHMPVYRDGQLVAHTDLEGNALVTGLRPFERNEITIDPSMLPPAVDVANTSFSAVPDRRGGVVVGTTHSAGGTVKVSDGRNLTIGTNDYLYAVYGHINALQDLPPGTYSDTITVTLNYN